MDNITPKDVGAATTALATSNKPAVSRVPIELWTHIIGLATRAELEQHEFNCPFPSTWATCRLVNHTLKAATEEAFVQTYLLDPGTTIMLRCHPDPPRARITENGFFHAPPATYSLHEESIHMRRHFYNFQLRFDRLEEDSAAPVVRDGAQGFFGSLFLEETSPTDDEHGDTTMKHEGGGAQPQAAHSGSATKPAVISTTTPASKFSQQHHTTSNNQRARAVFKAPSRQPKDKNANHKWVSDDNDADGDDDDDHYPYNRLKHVPEDDLIDNDEEVWDILGSSGRADNGLWDLFGAACYPMRADHALHCQWKSWSGVLDGLGLDMRVDHDRREVSFLWVPVFEAMQRAQDEEDQYILGQMGPIPAYRPRS